jgi:hypothetical protein
MFGFAARRTLSSLPVFFGASVVLFLLLYVLPGDPSTFVPGDSASPEQLAALRAAMGLDQPVLAQYFGWLLRLVRGDLGVSLVNGLPVTELIGQRLPVAAELTLGARLVALALGVSRDPAGCHGPCSQRGGRCCTKAFRSAGFRSNQYVVTQRPANHRQRGSAHPRQTGPSDRAVPAPSRRPATIC